MNILIAMIVPFLWGTTASATHLGFMDWPPLALAVLRSLPAGLLLLLIKPVWPKAGQWRLLLIHSAINIALFFWLIFLVAQNLPATFAAVGMAGTPVVALLFSFLYKGSIPNVYQVLACVLLVLATWTLFSPGNQHVQWLGIIAMVLAMVVMVAGSVFAQQVMSQVNWWTMVVWQLILGGIMLLPFAAWQWLSNPQAYATALDINMSRVLSGIWLVVINTALAYALFIWVLQRVSIVQFAFASIANPIGGVIIGAWLVHEHFSWPQYLIMAVMVATSLLAQWLSQKPRGSAAAKTTLNPDRVVS
ncbi:DMT family transporter [Gynuella sp.]|uniref:DMT family transporter n=1 Tax=Gynuella sp. TaxID=2969146 RepID=UPI003D0A7E06